MKNLTSLAMLTIGHAQTSSSFSSPMNDVASCTLSRSLWSSTTHPVKNFSVNGLMNVGSVILCSPQVCASPSPLIQNLRWNRFNSIGLNDCSVGYPRSLHMLMKRPEPKTRSGTFVTGSSNSVVNGMTCTSWYVTRYGGLRSLPMSMIDWISLSYPCSFQMFFWRRMCILNWRAWPVTLRLLRFDRPLMLLLHYMPFEIVCPAITAQAVPHRLQESVAGFEPALSSLNKIGHPGRLCSVVLSVKARRSTINLQGVIIGCSLRNRTELSKLMRLLKI